MPLDTCIQHSNAVNTCIQHSNAVNTCTKHANAVNTCIQCKNAVKELWPGNTCFCVNCLFILNAQIAILGELEQGS